MITKKYISFDQASELADATETLRMMMASPAYNTPGTYSSNTDTYADNMMPFMDKHLKYLQAHPKLNPLQYVANLKLMARIR